MAVLILGSDFGFQTSSGESVTQQEFRSAKASGKQILAFLQDTPAESPQADFCWEVSDYVDGLFRATFTSERELTDFIIWALNQLTVSRQINEISEFPHASWGGAGAWEAAKVRRAISSSGVTIFTLYF